MYQEFCNRKTNFIVCNQCYDLLLTYKCFNQITSDKSWSYFIWTKHKQYKNAIHFQNYRYSESDYINIIYYLCIYFIPWLSVFSMLYNHYITHVLYRDYFYYMLKELHWGFFGMNGPKISFQDFCITVWIYR